MPVLFEWQGSKQGVEDLSQAARRAIRMVTEESENPPRRRAGSSARSSQSKPGRAGSGADRWSNNAMESKPLQSVSNRARSDFGLPFVATANLPDLART